MSHILDIFIYFPQKIEYLIKELELILILKTIAISNLKNCNNCLN